MCYRQRARQSESTGERERRRERAQERESAGDREHRRERAQERESTGERERRRGRAMEMRRSGSTERDRNREGKVGGKARLALKISKEHCVRMVLKVEERPSSTRLSR